MPFSLLAVPGIISLYGDAGPLSQLESLSNFILSLHDSFARDTTAQRTKSEVFHGIYIMEEKFAKEKWSNEDRTDFYNISRDILIAAPSLFSDYLAVFTKLKPAQMKQFAKDIYPLYRAKLALLEQVKSGTKYFDPKQLLQLRHEIRSFGTALGSTENPFEAHKKRLLEGIAMLFKDRFGIIKIPDQFTLDHIRSFTNISKYLANLSHRSAQNETILGFYLSLMLNDSWENFRRGKNINPDEFLALEKAQIVKELLKKRTEMNTQLAQSLGLPAEDLPEFFSLLQEESSSIVVGNIETIDIKLTNIILNLKTLEDLDLYPEPLDKQRMKLLLDFGNKAVGATMAKMYQQLANPGRTIAFSEEEEKIRQIVIDTAQQNNLALNPESLKKYFQDEIKPLAAVVNFVGLIKQSEAEPKISLLREFLKPSEAVIKIFQRLGEDFQPTSGAIALSQDLNYLDNLIVKNEDELTAEEKETLLQYTGKIREQIVKLEEIYETVKNKFNSLRQSSDIGNPELQNRLKEIGSIIYAQSTQQTITSTATQSFNVMMENIRECLSCIASSGANNDTDLTFGDINKFYIYSQSENKATGSIADQIAFFEPIKRSDGSSEAAFVLDRVYGTNTPTILEN